MKRAFLAACLLAVPPVLWSAETVRVAFRENPGYSTIDETGTRRGYTTEWIQRLAMRLDWTIEWVDVNYGDSAAALGDGRVDISPFVLTSSGEGRAFVYTHVPIGYFRMALFVSPSSVFDAEDLSKMDGIIVGMMSRNPLRTRLMDYMKSHGIRCVCREFSSERDLIGAYRAGIVGAVLSEVTDSFKDEKLVFQLPPVPFYLAVSKSREGLVHRLDDAIAEITDGEPSFATNLRNVYFRYDTSRAVVFSPVEKSWLERQHRGNQAFTVDISPADGFIKIYDPEASTVGGLVGEILAEVSAQTGLKFRTQKPGSHMDVAYDFLGGKIDIMVPYGCPEAHNLTDPSRELVIPIPQAVAVRHFSGVDISDDRTTIAVARNDNDRIKAYQRLGLTNRMTIYPTAEDALQAVVEGRTDCFPGDYPMVNRLVARLSDPLVVDVRGFENSRYRPEIKVLVSRQADRNLVSVLSKTLTSFTRDHLIALENESAAKSVERGISLRRIISYAGGVAFVILLGIVAILIYFTSKTRKLLHKSEASLAIAQDAIDDAAMARTDMRVALEKAEYAAKSKSNFLATMSHEIRTPLNAVVGFSEFLAAPDITLDKVGEYARGISLSANALLSLINDILDLSKFESGRTEGLDIRIGECDVKDLFAEMESVFRMRVENKGLSLAFSGADAVPPLVLTEARLRQILLNLLGNAAKFTDRGGISVSTSYKDGIFSLQVKDTGIGISPRGIEHIFDPFSQDMDSRGGKVYAGTGLGLSIVKRIVEASSGRIWVDSVIGKGSTFFVEIPGVRTAPKKEKKAVSTATLRKEIKDVVIVDDVAMNRKVLKMHCLALGVANPIVFESGLQVLDYLKDPANPCDIVLSDMWMPGMDGSEVSKECAKLRPDLPVVAVTADTDAGATFDISLFKGILTKPVTADKLSKLLAQFKA